MKEVIIETLLDSIKLLPFLFFTFLLLEFIEHKLSKKAVEKIEKSGKYGPILGGLLGVFPQCGFSVSITNLYVTRIVSMGTLIAVYLSTSDEMLSILLANGSSVWVILKFVLVKVLMGIFIGFLIDLVINKKKQKNSIHQFCDHENCQCDHDHGIIVSTLKHVLSIGFFILIINFAINSLIYYVGEDTISKIFINNSFLAPFASSLVGLIPNCAASVIITELYISEIISFGTALAGLLTSSGTALLILFRVNHNLKENMLILSIVYGVGVISGIICNLLGA